MKYFNEILFLKGYKWLLSQNHRVRIDFLVIYGRKHWLRYQTLLQEELKWKVVSAPTKKIDEDQRYELWALQIRALQIIVVFLLKHINDSKWKWTQNVYIVSRFYLITGIDKKLLSLKVSCIYKKNYILIYCHINFWKMNQTKMKYIVSTIFS